MLRGIALGTLIVFGATQLAAQDVAGAIKARKAHMTLYSYNLGILGDMVKGKIDYDAALAASVSADLAKLSTTEQSSYWPAGSDNVTLTSTRTLPKALENVDDMMKITADMGAAATTLAGAAGDGLNALRDAFGPVAESCGACHKPYRGPRN